MDDVNIYNCMVVGLNSAGEPDFYLVKVQCTENQIDNGEHYRAAQEEALANEFEASFAFDEFDPAGTTIRNTFDWDDVNVDMIDISTNTDFVGYTELNVATSGDPLDPLADALDAVVADASRSNYDLSRLQV